MTSLFAGDHDFLSFKRSHADRPIFFGSRYILHTSLALCSPSSIYSWSIGHILEHEFFCLGRLGCAGSKEKKVDLSFSEQLLRVGFSTFGGQNFFFFENIVASALKSCIK